MTCNHDKYREYPYMTDTQAMQQIKEKNDICYMSRTVSHCECGVEIAHGRRVRVMSVKEYMDDQ